MYVCSPADRLAGQEGGAAAYNKYRPSRHWRWPTHTRQVLFLGEAALCLLAGKVCWPTYFRQTANHHFTLLRPLALLASVSGLWAVVDAVP